VHHRLVANQREVVNLRSFVATGFETMSTQISDAFETQEVAMKERDRQTGELYMSLAQKLLGDEGSSPVRTDATSRPRASRTNSNLENATTTATTTTTTSPSPLGERNHSLVMKHKSLHTIYYEWYGLENYANIPVVGGIAFLEEAYKSKWRLHFSPAEKQYFSRLQKVIKGIEEQGRREAKEPEKILEEWEDLFQKEGKSSVTRMSQMIQSMGLVATRKSRGKSRIDPEAV
jgi:hypothetical protein